MEYRNIVIRKKILKLRIQDEATLLANTHPVEVFLRNTEPQAHPWVLLTLSCNLPRGGYMKRE